MNHTELVELEKQYKAKLCSCDWCYRWIPEKTLRPFMKTMACNACYRKIRNNIRDPENIPFVFKLLYKNITEKTIDGTFGIVTIDRSSGTLVFKKHKESPQHGF